MDISYFDKLKQVESGGDPLAQNSASSAKGYYQFIDSTAKQYGLDKYKFGTPEYTQAEEGAVRKLTSDNYKSLKSELGREPTQGELYLAHQQGVGGASKILTSDQNAKAVDILGRDQVLNNGGNENMTISEFSNKWTSKFDKQDAIKSGIETAQSKKTDGVHLADSGQIQVDAFSDFGINLSDQDIDALSDFNVTREDQFILGKDDFGGLKKTMIDQSTGAPSYIRSAVGSLTDPESRLSTLRKYYPDAQPYGDGNFVYTDPESKNITLYNPVGFDRGDVASVMKEVFVTIGSTMGAVGGAAAGAITSVPTAGTAAPATVPAGAVIGAGIGAAAASNAWDLFMSLTGQTVDVRSAGKVATETAIDFSGGAAGEGIGRAIPVLAKESLGGAKAATRGIINQFDRLGIRPTMAVTQGAGAGRIEAGLAQHTSSAGIIQQQVNDVITQSNEALNKVISQYGIPKTKQGAGGIIVKAAEKAVESRYGINGVAEGLYDKAYNLVGEDTLVQVDNILSLRRQLQSEINSAPKSLAPSISNAIKRIDFIIEDAKAQTMIKTSKILDAQGNPIIKSIDRKGSGISFGALRSIRTNIGKDLSTPLTSGETSSQNIAMKRVYAALTEDLDDIAVKSGKEAESAISRANKYTNAYKKTAEELLNKILKYNTDENAYKFALSASKDGGTSLMKMRKLFTPQEWDDVSATVLSQLGEKPITREFSISDFVSNYNRLAPEAQDALFKGGKYKDASIALDDFLSMMEKLKEAGKYENYSNTAGTAQTLMLIQQLGITTGAAAAGAYTGEQTGFGPWAGMAFGILAPRSAAKLMTNPEFIKWLSKPVTEGAQESTAYFSKLAIIGLQNPDIKEEVDSFIDLLEKNTRE